VEITFPSHFKLGYPRGLMSLQNRRKTTAEPT
jgi:hypothetical protein